MIFMMSVSIFFVLSDICMGSDVNPGQSANDEEEFKWTPELDAIVKDIFYETKSKGGNHEKNMKEVWDRILPQFKGVKDYNLRQHAISVIYTRGEDKTHRNKWTPELESNLMEMYRVVSNSGKKGLSYKLHDEFYKKHPKIRRLTPQTLWQRARSGYEKYFIQEAEKMRARTLCDNEYTEDATRNYREELHNSEDQARRLYEEWAKLHPEQGHMKARSLQNRMRQIAQRQVGEGEMNSSKNYKWTRENNADIIHIRHRIKPMRVGFSRKFQELWGKMNPELKHMDKNRLRHRLNYLLKQQYKPTSSEDEESRMKFDSLIPPDFLEQHEERPEHVRDRKNERSDEGETAAGHLASVGLRIQDPSPHQFHDFMSVNHEENSNPTSHQQSDPGPSSTLQSTPRPFFHFF